jgi:hypothetical protein
MDERGNLRDSRSRGLFIVNIFHSITLLPCENAGEDECNGGCKGSCFDEVWVMLK